jgi:hypothetical protein
MYWEMIFLHVSFQRQWLVGCFRKYLFGIPRNTEFSTELTLFRVIPRNSAEFLLFNTAKFRGIPYKFVYTELRIPLNENSTRLNGANTWIMKMTRLKGQCHEIFRLQFFLSYNYCTPSPNRRAQNQFRIFPNIRGVIRICNWLPGNESTRELIRIFGK